MLSVHKAVTSGHPSGDFVWHHIFDPSGLAEHITRSVYSPIIWAGGRRGARYFRCAFWCALDFDEGPTKEDVRRKLAGTPYILAPTKSDGKVKGEKPACDRFRVLIPFKQPIWDQEVFEWNMRQQIERFGSDRVAYDAGRVWQPSSHVESISLEGEALDVSLTVPVEQTQEHKREQRSAAAKKRGQAMVWPDSVKRFVRGKLEPAERNDMLFRASCFFFENGWTVEKVRELVHGIPEMDTHDKIESTIKSAAKRTGASYF